VRIALLALVWRLHARVRASAGCAAQEHLDVAKTLNNLAIINKAMGDNHQALKHYQSVTRRSLRPRPAPVRLALVARGKASEIAERRALSFASSHRAGACWTALQRLSLDVKEKLLGPSALHPTRRLCVAACMRVCAECEATREAPAGAERGRRCSCICRAPKAALCPNHGQVAISLFNIALVHINLTEKEKARPLLERAIAIAKVEFGEQHQQTKRMVKKLNRLDGSSDGLDRD
jgi:Tfp pilus assembly protein PilF